MVRRHRSDKENSSYAPQELEVCPARPLLAVGALTSKVQEGECLERILLEEVS